MYHVINETYLSDNCFMDLAAVISGPNPGIRTIVYKKTDEPNVFSAVIDVAGDLQNKVIFEMNERIKNAASA